MIFMGQVKEINKSIQKKESCFLRFFTIKTIYNNRSVKVLFYLEFVTC